MTEHIAITYNLGASTLRRKYSSFQNMANGLSIPNEFSLKMATTPEFLAIAGYERRLNSVYASTQLSFDNTIFLDMTARNDWTSTLKAPHSYFYPSVGMSAIFNELLQMPAWVNFGKIRASYTQVGNDADPYLLRQLYSFGLGAGNGFISRSPIKAIPDLKPELTKSFEAGLDMKFFGNRLGFDLTLYKSNTVNQLLFLGLPMASGYSRQYINAGDIENRGLELQLMATPIKSEHFSWETTLNFASNTNKIIALHDKTKRANITDNNRYATVVVNEGEKYGDLYGYAWKRDPQRGKFVVDGSGLPVVEANQKLGNFNPKALLGWSNSFSYKGFTLNTLVDARIGGEIVSGTSAYLAAFGVADYTSMYREGGLVLDAVDANGAANTQAITAQQLWTRVSQNGRDGWGEFFTYDMTNVRLRELSITYRLDLKNTSVFKNAGLSLTGRNLFLSTAENPNWIYRELGRQKPDRPRGCAGSWQLSGCGSWTTTVGTDIRAKLKINLLTVVNMRRNMLYGALLGLSLISCSKDFDRINSDPNNITVITQRELPFMFAKAQSSAAMNRSFTKPYRILAPISMDSILH
ncbi:TonB-dependent receptor [Sphingobacterium sp. E70]|uniref:TonB-dependent receptor n=1 Tax=Sphingobacterium sp. E70 TaxID=2853439 RepID=UPI00211C825F|nr:TonB-dependent receptor [Sphingobacterium sp. E70]ULT25580.1 TonB-dependent receptor [Sphingobacterium sp. E70]